MDLLKEALPAPPLLTHSLCPPCSIPASRKNSAAQSWLSSSHTTMQSQPIYHCWKACQEIRYSIQNGVPAQTKYRKYKKSGSTSDIGHFDNATGREMAHNLQRCPFFSSEVSSRLSRQLVLSTTAHFHLECQKVLWTKIWHRTGVLQSHIFTANLFCNGIVLDYVSYSFRRNCTWNGQSKHQRAGTLLSSGSVVIFFFTCFFPKMAEKPAKKNSEQYFSLFVGHIPKIRQTKPEKLKKGLKFDIGWLCSLPFSYKV